MRRSTTWLFIAGIVTGLAACGGAEDETWESSVEAVTGTNPLRSLAVTDPEILARFGFTRTIDAIRSSALNAGQSYGASETRLSNYQRWMRSFGVGPDGCTRPSIDPNDYGLLCPRAPEAKLATVNPFAAGANVTFVPVGIFNRFDLMPGNGANCGEYRIVYALQPGPTAPLAGRGFIIFEAALPNPNPALGVDGCLPVAKFWQALTGDAVVSSRAAKLERFYYAGTAVPGFAPVVSARNYGLLEGTTPAQAGRVGQIRTNFFVDFQEWQLREFKLRKACPTAASCALFFDHVPVKANPAEELFAGTSPRSAAFRTAFIGQVASLARPNLNTIAMSLSNNFNEFESSSSGFPSALLYRNFDNAAIRADIQAELNRLGSALTVDNILNRATTQTCGGCHQVSASQALGGGLVWPNSNIFTHIDEQRNLSPALNNVFLPRRKAVLEAFINQRSGARVAAASASLELSPELTIGGQPVGAAN